MNREELAWAGGLFEGEGSLSLTTGRSGAKGTRAAVHMTDRDILERFAVAVGLGSITGPYARGVDRKPMYSWVTSRFESVQALIAMLWPWLGARRREQARLMLSGVTTKPSRVWLSFGKSIKELTPAERTEYYRRPGMSPRGDGRFCKRDHDIWVTGRYESGGCRVCIRDAARARYAIAKELR